jgi:hypothetical protein
MPLVISWWGVVFCFLGNEALTACYSAHCQDSRFLVVALDFVMYDFGKYLFKNINKSRMN